MRPGTRSAWRRARARPRLTLRRLLVVLALPTLTFAHPRSAPAQVVAEPILAGRVFLADTVLTAGTVVLHHVSTTQQGEIDSVAVAPDGSFLFRLPSVPDPATEEMYFASIRHDGVMYFGDAITRPVELDSLYAITAYDTLIAPAEGVPVTLEARSVFFEQSGAEWAITDVFQLRNDRDRTVVPRTGGRVWSYPLPEGAREVSSLGEMSEDVISQEGSEIVFRAALPPGHRSFFLRYFVDSLNVAVPTPGETGTLDVLVREPAPSIAVEGLTQDQSVQLEVGSTYRRFVGEGVTLPEIRVVMEEEAPPPPVEWIAVVLALVLVGGALLALRGGSRAQVAPPPSAAADRQAILVELARLDEEYEREASPSEARAREYERRRAELMARLRP